MFAFSFLPELSRSPENPCDICGFGPKSGPKSARSSTELRCFLPVLLAICTSADRKVKAARHFFVTLVCHRLRGPSRSCFTYRVLHPPYLVFLAALVWRLCEDCLPGFPQLDQNFHLEIWINYQWLNPLAWPALLRTYGRHASQLSTSDSFEVASITKMVTATVGLHNFVLTVGKFSRHTVVFKTSYWWMQKKFL